MTKDIYVTRPSMPPLSEFVEYLEDIWDSGILSNGGPFHQQLEAELQKYLKVENVSIFNNGTIALMTALRALKITGDVITTPFSFIATSHALLWNGNRPVFADIEPNSLNLSPAAIEAAITDRTTAIMPVHCYGNPADVEAIDDIGQRYGLKVIYDAAHAFGVERHDGSVLNFGDASVLSFHATKVFNTFEGGAIICQSPELKKYVDQLKNFGHEGETSVIATGLNGKVSEVNAAFGLVQLRHIDEAIDRRRAIDAKYRAAFADVAGVTCLQDTGQTVGNYSYFPILVGPEFRIDRDALYDHMKAHGVNPRRYFYPLIPEFPMYQDLPSARLQLLPNAYRASREILCLPIYPDLDDASLERIISLVSEA
ncbi:MAG: DegT/DnrJ/EryC1/StrS family aminotransferase [Paracoccaceae bacterium]